MNERPISVGGACRVLGSENIRALHSAACRSDEPPAVLLSLATLLPCNANAIAAAPIEMIDRELGLLRLKTPLGGFTEVALGFHAALAIDFAAGGRSKGPLVVDPHGAPVRADRDTEDYAKELLIGDDGLPLTFEWTFRSLREGVFADMSDFGVSNDVALAQAGYGTNCLANEGYNKMLIDQRAAADWWSYRIGLGSPSPFRMLRGMFIDDLSQQYAWCTRQRSAWS